MNLLALETGGEACSAAVLIDGAIASHRFEIAPRRHAQLILPMLEAVLADARCELRDLTAVAFGRGPGSFTGLRIAASVTQGIAFAADLPVLPVSTLAAVAYAAMREHGIERVVAAFDARMGEVYWGLYVADAAQGVRLIDSERVSAPQAVARADGLWYGAGDAWRVHGEVLAERVNPAGLWPQARPDAADIARLGAFDWQRGAAVCADQALPVYLRERVADRPNRAVSPPPAGAA